MRSSAPALVLLGGLLLPPSAAGARTEASFRSSTERSVFKLLNDIRREHKLPPFRFSVALRSAAREHSADMLARHYFEHDSPGETFDHRIRRHLDSSLVGENIAWGTGRYATPAGLVKLWMTSPEHRHIILMRGLHRIGLGVAIGASPAARTPRWRRPTSPPEPSRRSDGAGEAHHELGGLAVVQPLSASERAPRLEIDRVTDHGPQASLPLLPRRFQPWLEHDCELHPTYCMNCAAASRRAG